MTLLIKSVLHGRNSTVPVLSINHYAARLFSVKSRDESKSDASGQKFGETFPTNVDESKLTTTTDDQTGYKSTREDWLKAKPYSEIPEMPMVPIFGNAWKYFPIIGEYNSKRMYEADFKKQRMYGDILKERFGEFEVVNCYHKEANEVLLQCQGKYPARAEFSTLKAYREKRKHRYGQLGLVAMQGEEWANFRREVENSVQLIPNLNREAIVDIARDFVELIKAKRDAFNEVPDLMDLLYKWALESVSCIAMDARLGCLNPDMEPTTDGTNMIKSVHTQLECINKMEASSGNFPFWKFLPSPTWMKFEKAADVFTELVYKYITVTTNQFHLREGERKNTTILEKMLFEERMSTYSVMPAVADIIMAGIDTTSHAAGYFLYNLAKNPDKQQLLYEELLKHFSLEEKTSIKEIDYFTWCMWESMRLLPVVRGHMRILKRDAVLRGYRIPAGTHVLSVQQVFTRDARFYENPNKYIPERYENTDLVGKGFANPFGLGERSCLGEQMATLEIFAVIVEVLRNFRLEYNHEDIKLVTRLVNIPDRPIRMKFYDR